MLTYEMKSSKCDKLGLCLQSEPSGSSAVGCAGTERAGYTGEALGLGRERWSRTALAQPGKRTDG